MILTRFCSREEYNKFLAGEVLRNDTDHYQNGRGGSTSQGFCFSPDKPKDAWRYLKGIVSYDVCMVLDIDPSILTRSKGKYADYSTGRYKGFQCVKTEYCSSEYSNKSAKLVKTLWPEQFATQVDLEALMFFKKLGISMPLIKR